MKKKVALITGSNGYIGSNLVARLNNFDWDVHVVVRKTSDLSLLKPFLGNISVYTSNGSVSDFSRIIGENIPDVVFHLASMYVVEHTPSDVSKLIDSNVQYGSQLLEGMKLNGVKNLINTGTSWQNYRNNKYDPVSLYAASKQAFQDIVDFYVHAHDFKVITLKLFDTYGPLDPRKKLIQLLRLLWKNAQHLEMSPGDQLIDIVYIDDVIDAYMSSVDQIITDQTKLHEVYAVSSGEIISLKELVGLFEVECGEKLNIVWGGKEYRKREVMTPWETGTSVPNWKPKISLAEGLRKVIASS